MVGSILRHRQTDWRTELIWYDTAARVQKCTMQYLESNVQVTWMNRQENDDSILSTLWFKPGWNGEDGESILEESPTG